ncbi:MAG: hypothetical protein VX246_01575 [Myxococcota bacterium]|nr:hypothetical protein [Myxococcota bacterium]
MRFRLLRVQRLLVGLMVAVSLLSAPLAATADDYDSEKSGHPLRVIGYILYPVGLLIDTLIFRPAHWIGSHEPFETLFGHDED